MREVYLDHAASSPLDERVLAAMLPYFKENFANPSSLHRLGLAAERGLKQARAQLAQTLRVAPEQVIFTSGGTEANALGILGPTARGEVVVASAIEHPSALGSARHRAGEAVRTIPVSAQGIVEVKAFAAACDEAVSVATCMLVNNEVGTVQPIAELARALRARGFGGHFHVDGVQAFGKLPVRFAELGVDSLALSAHKIHGPKGAGALIVRRGAKLHALLGGGKQESGLRPGTENVPAIVGFGLAAELAARALAAGEEARMAGLRERLIAGLDRAIVGCRPSCGGAPCAPHIVSLIVPGVAAEVFLHAAEERGVTLSAGAACASRSRGPSHVLRAIGLAQAESAVRLSLGRTTTEDDIDFAIGALEQAHREARL